MAEIIRTSMEDFKLKNVYSRELITGLATLVSTIYTPFQAQEFQDFVLDAAWNGRELKERMRHITLALRKYLPDKYADALQILRQAAPQCEGFPYLFFPDFVEQYGLEYEDISIPALELFTQFSSAEFVIRPFIIKKPEQIMAQMLAWAEHPNHHVRRLASEGSRPRLPWGMALKQFQRDPAPILPILERLKADESDYVRRSVANNLNDIAKDHPEVVLGIAKRWKGANPHTDWIVRHSLRTLLKRGNSEALALFGLRGNEGVTVSNLHCKDSSVAIGETTTFSFDLSVQKAGNIRLEYGVYYVKANGEASRKVFFIHEKEYAANTTAHITRKISFQQRTTRKHYAGVHRLTVIVSGIESAETSLAVTA
ncbi:MAG: DNA alkylation repair protein [Candidatus Kapabacteria bacterium]|nr:DNA alkylation repair protein [Candidatus Kapabacteria bacterium]